jgi:signal transduction histidine kinase
MLFRNFFKTKLNASTDYLVIFIIINLGVFVMSVTSGVSTYRNNLSSNHQSLEKEALRAENIITEAINEHSWQIRSLADKIMKTDNNLAKINQIITSHNKLDSKSNFDQFLNQKDLFWVDKNDNVVIKNKVGILSYPQKIADTYEVFNSRKNSWKLIISEDLPHFQNDYNLILTSFGVTDENGKYMGSIVSSIDVNLIQDLLIKNLPTSTGNLAILSSHNNHIAFQSNPNEFVSDANFFAYKLNNIDYAKNQSGYINQDLSEQNTRYSYYKKLPNYPFTILAGYDHKLYQSQLLRLLLKTIYPNILIGSIFLIMLFLFYKRTIKPVRDLSEIAKKIGSNDSFDDKFPRKINSPEIYELTKALLRIKYQRIKLEKSNQKITTTKDQLEEAIEVIKRSDLAQIEIIKQIRKEIFKNTGKVLKVINMMKYNLETHVTSESKINLFLAKSIEQEIINITNFATDELNKEYVDIYHIVDRVVLSQEKEIKIRKIKLDVSCDKKLPKKVFVDQIRLIQILSGILNKTVKLLAEGDKIKISVRIAIRNKERNLAIKIQDNGVGIGFKEHIKDMEKYGKKEENAVNGIDIGIDTIEELIDLHHGEIFYDNKIHQGSSTTIIIPYTKKVKKTKPLPSINKKSANNIIQFPVRIRDV